MNLEPFTGPGSTPSRRRFWDKVTAYVIASQKVAGENVTVAEHQGAATIININRVRGLEGGVGACCYDDGTCDDLNEADCNDAGGNWQGTGTTCADDPNPCLGACCEGEGGTTCVEDSTPDSCAADGGTFQDFGSTCDPDPCVSEGGACCLQGNCSIQSNEVTCLASGEGAYYLGDGTTCGDVDCSVVGCCQHFTEGVGSYCVNSPETEECNVFFGTGLFCCEPNIIGNATCCLDLLQYCCNDPANLDISGCCYFTEDCCYPFCCDQITQTCCEAEGTVFGCCDNATEECCGAFGCVPIGTC